MARPRNPEGDDLDPKKPTGSGWFAMSWGVVLGAVFVFTFVKNIRFIKPYHILQGWLGVAALILIAWGRNRVLHGQESKTIGQDTINLVVAIMGLTATIFAILVQK